MALIDALLDKITNESLRQALREQVDQLLTKQSFGLVFQQHKPETVELHNYTVRRNCKVRINSEESDELYVVDNVKKGTATIRSLVDEPKFWDISVQDLVVVREFGDPIYAGLRSVGSVERGGDAPPHVVINAENFHALETLLYTHEEKVDAIYIDPPYNTRDKDWKYNNNYVDSVDTYKHSKWLAFMQRRLELAQRLLNPERSVLVVTIDENEVHHLGMLLEDMFKDAVRQMVTIVINPLGQARKQELARVDEYAFFVFIGDAKPSQSFDDLLAVGAGATRVRKVRWEWLLRGGTNSRRQDRPNLFYPIFIDPESKQIAEVGEALPLATRRTTVKKKPGLTTVWPLRTNGDEGNWRTSPSYLRELIAAGHAKAGAYDTANDRWSVLYLGKAQIKRIESGEIEVIGRDEGGAVMLRPSDAGLKRVDPKTVWFRPAHRSGEYGSTLVKKFVPGRAFPFPKSVYAVQDTLRVMVGENPNATVVDFFAGSGTTAHALALLNADDGGRRRAIMVTNNEVSAEEAAELRARGHRPGDSEWEQTGIFHHITKPRVEAAITGVGIDGRPLDGEYLDGSPFSAGLEANAEFFELTYLDPDLIARGRGFEDLAALLWLKAGGVGPKIEKPTVDWALPEGAVYGVLFDSDKWREFVDAVTARNGVVRHVFVATEAEATFQQIVSELPAGIATTRLYEEYLSPFELNTKGRR